MKQFGETGTCFFKGDFYLLNQKENFDQEVPFQSQSNSTRKRRNFFLFSVMQFVVRQKINSETRLSNIFFIEIRVKFHFSFF